MSYENLVKKHFDKLLQEKPNSTQFGRGNMKEVINKNIQDKILIHCLVKIDGSPENAQKTLEKITLQTVEEYVDYPQYINDAEDIFNTLSQMIKKQV